MLNVKLDSVRPEGQILMVDKPEGWTSHDVVAKIRGELGRRGIKTKVGHGGTLDPLATGVLLVLLGEATKRFEEIRGWEKEYVVEIKLGEETETGDAEGKVIRREKVGKIREEEVKRVLKKFKGEYVQEVPRYSAKKVKGRKLYELARKGEKVKLPKQKVEIKEVEVLELEGERLEIRVVCSGGTYMRQLAKDVGKELGGIPAYAEKIQRTRVGRYKLL